MKSPVFGVLPTTELGEVVITCYHSRVSQNRKRSPRCCFLFRPFGSPVSMNRSWVLHLRNPSLARAGGQIAVVGTCGHPFLPPSMMGEGLDPPVVPFLFFGGGFPQNILHKAKGSLILTSLLDDLEEFERHVSSFHQLARTAKSRATSLRAGQGP